MGCTISLATMPLSFINLVFLIAVRGACLATLLWFQTTKAIITLPLHLCWMLMVWITAFLLLPLRIFTALQKETTLEMNLNEMQIRLESLAWENKELEERLQLAVKDRKVIETVFEEIEEEHEKAVSRIDLLENELQDLKIENLRLNEVHGKGQWNYKARDDGGGYVHEGIPLAANYGAPSWGSSYKGSGVTVEEILMQGKAKEEYNLKAASSCPFTTRDLMIEEAILERRRVVAVYRSLFSAMLSLLVGTIIWEAEDPCVPLVAALFSVVGMSLSSVVQFFSTIKNKPASDAVALLSVNWFILGTLTSPSLPTVVHILAPRAIKLADQVACWVGLSAYIGR